jgi:AraC family transcriptional regulator of adaptative response/methylated-DNA-[protein]-cysteine methyltransferase
MFNAVKTTKIYCRPECSARPKPESVTSYPTREAAERAGYRACKRCRPDLDERLRYGVGHSELGRTTVVVGEGGVRGVFLGDEDPKSVFLTDFLTRDRSLDPVARNITKESAFDLDMRGTAFQQEVWLKLLEIPRGETWTYTQLAAALGKPKAVRAVGAACGQNRIGVLVPCHRVVRTDGSLAGYRWGLERKRALLEAEGAL